MTDEVEGKVEAKAEEKVEDVIIDEPKGEDQADAEAEARRMGWLPEDEYKGDKSRWRDAKSFLDRGKNELPILRERLKKMDQELLETRATLKEFGEFHTKVEKAAYDRAYKEIKEEQKAAVLTQDVDAFDRAEEKLDKLRDSIPKAPTVKFEDPQVVLAKENAEAAKQWESDPKNSWVKDKEMYSFAVGIGQHLRTMGNDKPMAEFLEDVSAEVKRLRPEKFKNSRRDEAPDVEGSKGIIRGKGKSFSDLDPDAKAAGERFVKQGLYKSKEDYAKKYFELSGE